MAEGGRGEDQYGDARTASSPRQPREVVAALRHRSHRSQIIRCEHLSSICDPTHLPSTRSTRHPPRTATNNDIHLRYNEAVVSRPTRPPPQARQPQRSGKMRRCERCSESQEHPPIGQDQDENLPARLHHGEDTSSQSGRRVAESTDASPSKSNGPYAIPPYLKNISSQFAHLQNHPPPTNNNNRNTSEGNSRPTVDSACMEFPPSLNPSSYLFPHHT